MTKKPESPVKYFLYQNATESTKKRKKIGGPVVEKDKQEQVEIVTLSLHQQQVVKIKSGAKWANGSDAAGERP